MLIKVMDDYGCWPLWVRDDRNDVYEPRDPATLGLSGSLVGRLASWRQWSESMVNIVDPNDSRPVTADEDAAFAAEGRLLAARVADELPHAVVWFYQEQPTEQPNRRTQADDRRQGRHVERQDQAADRRPGTDS
ncbi:hypothetical protein M8C17_10045 [Micromonospora sp. RHAY321]|uniref:hypothetical protein n=1 Tax=Micromonospora sp. RHAY321 TaxID=2944807 RepID=UPI00207C1F2C|nr:hypothetical protein [Micromonospora sp. RHAY321]MCO1595507.1 hypothetical protein [Micromonospora sp. RHAY321]